MNGTYEIEYHLSSFEPCHREVVTVDGRNKRENRTPVSLLDYARKTSKMIGAYQFRIHAIKLRHITPSNASPMYAHLIFEEATTPDED
jgi:hypothetical protein